MRKSTLLLILLSVFGISNAQLSLPAIFHDGMVLQRGKELKIWGKTSPGKVVSISFNNEVKTANSDQSGAFSLNMAAPTLSHVAKTMKVKCESDSIIVNDILVGDVFLLSGQSNMEWEISKLDAAVISEATADANYSEIRYYKVAKNWINGSVYGNDANADATWVKTNSTTAVKMSAIGFYFGRKLYKEKNIPIGLIDCSQGASYGEAWIAQAYIDSHPELKPYLVAPVTGDPVTNYAQHYRNPGILYKKMLSRVLPYSVGGILWYQGEANTPIYNNYKKVLPAVIDNFRTTYSDAALPFVIIQLSAYENVNFWPYTREIQDSVANSTANAAMVSTIDVGSATSIHPLNKKPVGERCVLAMRKLMYNDDLVYSGPTYESVRFEGNKVIITFKNANGLKTIASNIAGFEICDEGFYYQPITGAQISGNTITVWRDGVNFPKAVRYGWSNFPPANLYNDTNLPANPFRTSKQTTSNFTSNVYYVSASAGNDNNVGSSAFPFATIARATSVVNRDYTTIFVAAGTYNFSASATIKPYNQTIIGEDAANTILNGNNTTHMVDGITEFQNSDKSLTIKNLSFKNGFINITATIPGGAAIATGVKTNLIIENCYFYKNNATSTSYTYGGAVFFDGRNLTVNRCFFEENTSLKTGTGLQGHGGAIAVRHKLNVGAATYALIKNSTFYKNSGSTKGGAIYFNKLLNAVDTDNATYIIQNCLFLENTILNNAQSGAAIAISSGTYTGNKEQTIILTNNTMCNNYCLDGVVPAYKNTVMLEGSRYAAYFANNIMTGNMSSLGQSLIGNQVGSIEYGKNNIIDAIDASIDGTDFTTNAAEMQNQVAAVTPEELKLSTTLSDYPISDSFSVPYLKLNSGSTAINKGANSYKVNTFANPVPAPAVEYILTSDILGSGIIGTRDLGAWESDVQSAIKQTYNTANKISVQYSPASGILTVLSDLNIEHIQIFDATGKNVFSARNEKSIGIGHLKSGVYLIYLKDIKDNTYSTKLTK